MKRTIQLFFCAIIFAFCSSCSPGMFFESGEDKSVTNLPSYRKVNTACASINLESSQIDVPTFRSILKCFNAYHALDDLDQLVNGPDGLKDYELAPIVKHLNQYVLNDPKRLFEMESTYQALQGEGILEESLDHLGKLLKNEDFIAASIPLLVDGFLSASPSSPQTLAPDPILLNALKLISTRLAPESVQNALELAILVSESRPFQDLLVSFRSPNRQGKTAEDLVKELDLYLKESHAYTCTDSSEASPVQREMKADLIDYVLNSPSGGGPFDLLDQIVGAAPSDISRQVPKLSALFTEMAKDPQGQFDDGRVGSQSLLRNFWAALHDLSGPIQCMKDGASVPSGTRHLVTQLIGLSSAAVAPRHIFQTMPLDLMALGPFCSYPPRLNDHYKAVVELSKMGLTDSRSQKTESGMVTLVELLRGLNEVAIPWRGCAGTEQQALENYHPLTAFIINGMGADGDPRLGTGLSHLIPIVADLAGRMSDPASPDSSALTHLLLVLSLVDEAGRATLSDAIRFIVTPQPILANKNLMDVFLQALSKQTSPQHLVHFVLSLGKFADFKETFLGESLRTLRKAYYVNSAHPVLDLVTEALRDAPQNGDFYGALLVMAQKPKFKDSIRLIAEMSRKEDGRLSALLGSIVSLFHKFAEQGRTPIQTGQAPGFQRIPKHHLTHDSLALVSAGRNRIDPSKDLGIPPECLRMNLNSSIANSKSLVLSDFLKCQGDSRVGDAIHLLTEVKTERGNSFYDFLVGVVSDATSPIAGDGFNKDELNYLVQQFIDPSQYKMMNDLLDFGNLFLVPDWGSTTGSSGKVISASSGGLHLLDPVFDMATLVMKKAQAEFQNLETFVADQLVKKDFPRLMLQLDEFLEHAKKIVDKKNRLASKKSESFLEREVFTDDLRAQVREKVIQYECDLTGSAIDERVDEIIEDARKGVSVTELAVGQKTGQFIPKAEWPFLDVDPFANFMLSKVADPAQSDPSRTLLDAHLNFFRRFQGQDLSTQTDPDEHALAPAQASSPSANSRFSFYTPAYLLQWLHERSTDFKPVVIFPHGCLHVIQDSTGNVTCEKGKYYVSDKPKVVLYNSLNRLDRLLYEVAFPGPLLPHKNLGLDFPQEIAEAWGDRDQADWPQEIAQELKNKKPRDMAEAVEDILNRPTSVLGMKTENLDWLTWAVGYPKAGCYSKGMDWPAGGLESLMKLIAFFSSEPGTDVPAFKARLFNLNQTREVLRENAHRKDQGKTPAGLEVLRDLFFEIYYSTPQSVRAAKEPSAQGKANNLMMILLTVRLGGLSQIGKMIEHFDPKDPEVIHFIEEFIRLVHSPQAVSLLFDLLTLSPAHVGKAVPPAPSISGLRLMEAMVADPVAGPAWDQFSTHLEKLRQSDSYQKLSDQGGVRLFLNFIEERGSSDPRSKQAARKLREYLTRRIRVRVDGTTDLEQIFVLARKDRKRVTESLMTLNEYMRKGRLKNFLEMVKQSLSEPTH